MRRVRLAISLAVAALIAGCNTFTLPPTPAPIIVTATFEPPPAAPSPSPVLGVLDDATRTPLPTASPTPTPLPTLAPTLTPSFTPTFTDVPNPTPDVRACPILPAPEFAATYQANAALAAALGCPAGGGFMVSGAVQEFENGRMVWASSLGELPGGVIYALLNGGTYSRYPDTWREGIDPALPPGAEGAPSGRLAPVRGFGKVWAGQAGVRGALGWALAPENGTGILIQRFERGEMARIDLLGRTLIFAGGQWR